MEPAAPRTHGRFAHGYARTVVFLRYVVILAWIGLAVAANQLPHITQSGGGGDLQGFVPSGSRSLQTELRSFHAFGFPLISRTVLVQRDPDGLSPYTQAEAVLRALALDQGSFPDASPVVGGLPILNTRGLFPSSSERGTTAVTYLFVKPGAGFATQTRAAREFAKQHVGKPDDALVGVTGSVPARVAQGRILTDTLPLLELATLGAIILIVSLNFRALAAPLLALSTAGVAFFVATRLAGLGGALLGIAIPSELEPLILALMLGVVTDYVIFFLAGMRRELQQGRHRLEAARTATETFGPIVAVAGLTVAGGTAALLVARSGFFRAFGPAMAVAVLVALVVSVTLVPALMAVFGRLLFWPAVPHASVRLPPAARAPRGRPVRIMTVRPVALLVVLVCVAGLGAVAMPVRDLTLGVSFVESLPRSTEERQAADAAAAGFAPGILSPTVLLLQDDGIARHRPELAELGRLLAGSKGVAGVVGPGTLLPQLEQRVLVSSSGDDARYFIVLDDEPLGATAIGNLEQLMQRLPGLLDGVGLHGVRAGFGGDTALAGELVSATRADLGRIALAALLVNLLLLVAFLRSLLAPVYLLACSVLALAAALGATTYVFQKWLGHDGITFYVPFAAAVLLLSLGSDYNIFGVGHIWAKARQLPLRQAVIAAVPETTRAITAAGVTLAASFGMLALVPLRPFRELAFVMAVGILLDALVVRSLLVPTLLVLVGKVSGWPWGTLGTPRPTTSPEPDDVTRTTATDRGGART
ncbi:MAG: MMPL family transporter [Actinomycetes bacterium]